MLIRAGPPPVDVGDQLHERAGGALLERRPRLTLGRAHLFGAALDLGFERRAVDVGQRAPEQQHAFAARPPQPQMLRVLTRARDSSTVGLS